MSEETIEQTTGKPQIGQAESTSTLLDTALPSLNDGEYYLSDGIKGVGESPEWFDSKRFKSVDQQAKSYLELEKVHCRTGSLEITV